MRSSLAYLLLAELHYYSGCYGFIPLHREIERSRHPKSVGTQRLYEKAHDEEDDSSSSLEIPVVVTKSSIKEDKLRSSEEIETNRYSSKNEHLPDKKLDLFFCGPDACRDTNRERIINQNQVVLTGPATGQVAYEWTGEGRSTHDEPTVLFLVREGSEDLLELAANAIQALPDIHVLLDPSTAARVRHYHGVEQNNIRLWEPEPTPGYGSDLHGVVPENILPQNDDIDLICTIGGDGLLLHTAMLFPGPMPPILSVSGGSLGFLTPFKRDEMVDAIRIALDLREPGKEADEKMRNERSQRNSEGSDLAVFPPNMPTYPYEPLESHGRTIFNSGPPICLSIRMRLECRIVNRHGSVRARYNVLNEVVIDRGSSSYLASLECFCDDVHLTTVQADGIIFATPTGSTAYSMAAGGSVVHPSVPAILVTPICPHVLSFRSMVFPDHVVLRCLVPDDARSTASVALDGAQRRHELHRGDYVLVAASRYPVPTINRGDHSSDWLGSLKENFHFNTRRRQRPLK